jgi:hypothetical protein
MTSVRRTISLPPHLAARIERAARQRGVSFSAVVADLADRAPEELPYAGLVEDDEDLSLRVEEVLRRLAS